MTKHQQMRASELAHYEYVSSRVDFEAGYEAAVKEAEVLVEALKKIADPRLRDHKEPDQYTELGCVMHMADEALREYLGDE